MYNDHHMVSSSKILRFRKINRPICGTINSYKKKIHHIKVTEIVYNGWFVNTSESVLISH